MTTSKISFSTATINAMTTVSSQINYRDYYKGLALALSSCVFIGTSFIVKKKGLLRVNRSSGSRAGEGGYAYLKEWMWWVGLITMVVGEAANFTAYAFAPAILVTPLGAISVIVSIFFLCFNGLDFSHNIVSPTHIALNIFFPKSLCAVLASIMLKERLNLHGKVGCFLCVIGSTVLVIHAPPEENVSDMEELSAKLRDPLFIGYTILVLLVSMFLIIYVSPKYGKTNILVYVAICSLFGSLTVSACKGLGIAIKETLAHNSQVSNPIAWMLLIGGALCIMVQMNFLNKALDIFNTSIVSPIYYVMFTTFAIIASAILYKEWAKLNAKDALGSVCGFLTIIIGVFLLHAFKDIKFSFQDLYGSVTIKSLTNGESNVLINELESDEDADSNLSNNYLTSKF